MLQDFLNICRSTVSFEHDVFVLNMNNNKICVKSSICPHFGGPITYDKVNNYLFCYWHGLKFTINGKCINQKDSKLCLNSYDYELKGNSIYIIKNENTRYYF